MWVLGRSLVLAALVLGAWIRLGRPFEGLGLDVPVHRTGQFGFILDGVIAAYYLYVVVLRRRSKEQLEAVRARLERLHSMRMLPTSSVEYLLFPWVAIVGSAVEEILFRGYLLWFLAPLVGVTWAVVISAVAFGLAHAYLGRIGMARTAAIGLTFGVAYVATHSLWWLMMAHATVNLFGLPLQRHLQSARPATS